MSQETKIRILIVDDHPVVREGLTASINYQENMIVVGSAVNGSDGVELYRKYRPDVTLMDLRMPEMDGVAAITAIRTEFANARILVLTTYDGDDDIYRGLHAGASGYLLKDAPTEEVVGAIRSIHRGSKYVSPAVAQKLAEHVSSTHLTQREIEVLGLVAKGNSNQQVAKALFIVEGTVKAHITNILIKLNAVDRTQAVTEALRRGILHLD